MNKFKCVCCDETEVAEEKDQCEFCALTYGPLEDEDE